MQYDKITQKNTNKHKRNLGTVKWAQWNKQNSIQRTVRTAHLSVPMTVRKFNTQYSQHRTVLIISPLSVAVLERFTADTLRYAVTLNFDPVTLTFDLWPPDNHYSSDVVYRRKKEGFALEASTKVWAEAKCPRFAPGMGTLRPQRGIFVNSWFIYLH